MNFGHTWTVRNVSEIQNDLSEIQMNYSIADKCMKTFVHTVIRSIETEALQFANTIFFVLAVNRRSISITAINRHKYIRKILSQDSQLSDFVFLFPK